MSAVQPDAWDECATCGHDREDHNPSHGGCTFWSCRCPAFTEATA